MPKSGAAAANPTLYAAFTTAKFVDVTLLFSWNIFILGVEAEKNYQNEMSEDLVSNLYETIDFFQKFCQFYIRKKSYPFIYQNEATIIRLAILRNIFD